MEEDWLLEDVVISEDATKRSLCKDDLKKKKRCLSKVRVLRTLGAGWGSETGPRPHEVEPGNVHV